MLYMHTIISVKANGKQTIIVEAIDDIARMAKENNGMEIIMAVIWRISRENKNE